MFIMLIEIWGSFTVAQNMVINIQLSIQISIQIHNLTILQYALYFVKAIIL